MTLATAKNIIVKNNKVNEFVLNNNLRTQQINLNEIQRKLSYIDRVKFDNWYKNLNK